jgi:xylono-1,5-lactonase
MTKAVRCAWPVRAVLGEGPVWDARDNSVYFVDIKGRALHRLNLDSDARQSWSMPEPLCWVIPHARARGFLAGFNKRVSVLSLDPLTIAPLHECEPERRANRLNDAKADRFGRVWFGSMDDDERNVSGALYRLDRDLSCRRMDDGYAIANGPTFSPDGRRLYHTDTGTKTVFAFDLSDEGALANKATFIRFDDASWGAPDGMTVDAEGGVWVAHWGGARVSRFTPDGKLDRAVALPVSQITSCVFAGPALDRMFVTSAAIGREADEPLAGALFEIDPGVRGAPAFAFGG